MKGLRCNCKGFLIVLFCSMSCFLSSELNNTLKEKTQLSLLLNKTLQEKMQLSFLWRLCNKSTPESSRHLPGWAEHISRCFFLSQEAEKWEVECLGMGGDLAVVLNAEDQAFLTCMTFLFPQENFHSAWTGLQDVEEALGAKQCRGLVGQNPGGTGLCCHCPTEKHWTGGLVKLLG